MCGLAGVVGPHLSKEYVEAFRHLLILSALRGIDSTGVAVVHGPVGDKTEPKDVDWKLMKTVGNVYDLITHQKFNELVNKFDARCIIGHNRWATRGAHTRWNAHPFEFQELVGAHNGTIDGHLPDQQSFGTDSECLYANIIRRGLKETIADTRGAWALTYYDAINMTLNLLRNKERPLWICAPKKSPALFWASEARMLEFALDRVGIEHFEPAEIKEDVLIAYKIFKPMWWLPENIYKEEIKGKEAIVYQNNHAPFRHGNTNSTEIPSGRNTSDKNTLKSSTTETTPPESEAEKLRQILARLPHQEQPQLVGPPTVREEKPTAVVPLVPRPNPKDDKTLATGSGGTQQPNGGRFRQAVEKLGGGRPDLNKLTEDDLTYMKGFNGVPMNRKNYKEILGKGCVWCGGPIAINHRHRWFGPTEVMCDDCMNDKHAVESMIMYHPQGENEVLNTHQYDEVRKAN